jgi:hypothetical protein
MRESSSFRGADDLSFAATEEFGGDLTEELRARVKRELEPGERLLWAACSLAPPFRIGRGFLKGDAIRVQTVARGQVGNLIRVERPDGSGTLEFAGTRGPVDFDYSNRFQFERVPEVRRVEQIVRNNLVTSERGA